MLYGVKMKAIICVLTWNRFDYTKKTFEALIQNTNRDEYELLLFDNGSTEPGMLEWMKNICLENKFDYVFCKINVGLTPAMNIQMKLTRHFNYDVFCHIANDVVVPKNWLTGILKAVQHKKVGLVGLNLELEEDRFELESFGDFNLEKLLPECNVGGMAFCIPTRVYDILGGFQNVNHGYGQQDANYSLQVKLLPNDWWIYYLPKKEYMGEHLGLLNFEKIDYTNKDKVLYTDYHKVMTRRLKNSGNDVSGGRNYRNMLQNLRRQYDQGKITKEQLIESFKAKPVPVIRDQILETSLNLEEFH
jgi:glycosyltransferase involved in cell wall biosynthesis